MLMKTSQTSIDFSFTTRKIYVRLTEPEIVQQKREHYKTTVRSDFISNVRKEFEKACEQKSFQCAIEKFSGLKLSKLSEKIETSSVHHIVPLSLGGDNRFQNLCIIDNKLHRKIHDYINQWLDILKEKEPTAQNFALPIPIVYAGSDISSLWFMRQLRFPKLDNTQAPVLYRNLMFPI